MAYPLASLLLAFPAIPQCGYFNGPPHIIYLGCANDNDQVYGRSYRIEIPLNCYNNCGAALPGHPFIIVKNVRTGFTVQIWRGDCDFYGGSGTPPCAGSSVSEFTLLDRDFLPGDQVQIQTFGQTGRIGCAVFLHRKRRWLVLPASAGTGNLRAAAKPDDCARLRRCFPRGRFARADVVSMAQGRSSDLKRGQRDSNCAGVGRFHRGHV